MRVALSDRKSKEDLMRDMLSLNTIEGDDESLIFSLTEELVDVHTAYNNHDFAKRS